VRCRERAVNQRYVVIGDAGALHRIPGGAHDECRVGNQQASDGEVAHLLAVGQLLGDQGVAHPVELVKLVHHRQRLSA